MISLFRPIFLLLSLILFWTQEIKAVQQRGVKHNPSIYVSNEVWEQVQDYLMPDDHPMKEKLDQIFSNSRALADQESMVAAGFAPAQPMPRTKITVTRHSEIPGYVIKAYLDVTPRGGKNRPEHYFLIKRVIGSRLIQKSIRDHNYEHLLKVPKKWIYLLPDEPSPPPHYLRKVCILVEDDMDIFDNKKNKKKWGSKQVTKELLKAFYTVITELTLSDSTKLPNCPFSRDGRVSLIDTQMFNTGYMKYDKLTRHLSPPMQTYWKELISNAGQK